MSDRSYSTILKALFIPAIICFFSLETYSQAQSILFPPDYLFDMQRQGAVLRDTENIVHTSLQPFIYKSVVPDTLKRIRPGADPFFDKLFYENLIQIRHVDKSSGYDRKFNLDINPVFGWVAGKDFGDSSQYKYQTNSRGFWIRGELGKSLIFESAFIENQAFFPSYMSYYTQGHLVVPGQGRFKVFKKTGFDYSSAYGLLQFKISNSVLLRFGHGKQKIGNGYRSLLLGDNAFNYPYVQCNLSFFKNRLQYSQTYALLMNLTDGGSKTPPNTEPIFQKKAATFQHLSWHTGRHFDIYFFQGTIWKATDSSNRMHLDPLYANPVIFGNLAKFGFNNENHIVVGGGFELRLFKCVSFYGQGVYDGMYTDYSGPSAVNRPAWGVQNGLKYFNVAGLKNLNVQVESNILQGQCYYNVSNPAQNYSHYNQLLTTPSLLPNEFVMLATYGFKRVFTQFKQNYFTDFKSGRKVTCTDMRLGYLFNPQYNATLSLGCFVRSQDDDIVGKKLDITQVVYLSLKTSLYNIYNDF